MAHMRSSGQSQTSLDLEQTMLPETNRAHNPPRFVLFPAPHNGHEVPGPAWSGGPGHRPFRRGAEGNRDPASPPSVPLPGGRAGGDQAR